MNILNALEYSAIILIMYIVIRSEAARHFSGQENKGATALIIFLGAIIFIWIDRTIGIIIILLGVAVIIIPNKKEALQE